MLVVPANTDPGPRSAERVARHPNLAACGVKWRSELREPAHHTFAKRRRARPPCDPQIVLALIIVLVLLIFDYEEKDEG